MSFFTRFLPCRTRQQPERQFVVRSFRLVDPSTSPYHSRISTLQDQEQHPLTIDPSIDDMASDSHRHKRAKHDDLPKKETCLACYTEIDGPYLTPCLTCKKPQCYDCIKVHFLVALKDAERMPPRCCGRVYHHDVAKGVLSPAEHDTYKLRWDENQTTDRFYCPVPTCSRFIPPRNLKPIGGKLTCPACTTISCVKCKQVAGPGHVCSSVKEGSNLIDSFKYKQCPKCKAAVMKMYGCPHMRCGCGAHWCWDCRRPINICCAKPCVRARNEGEVTDPDGGGGDELSEPESESTVIPIPRPQSAYLINSDPLRRVFDTSSVDATNEQDNGPERARTATSEDSPIEPRTEQLLQDTARLVDSPSSIDGARQPPVPGTPVLASTSGPVVSNDDVPTTAELQLVPSTIASAPEIRNLDDPDHPDIDWEGNDYDFGEEPTDEDWDVFGCLHRTSVITGGDIPEKWFVDLDKEKPVNVECMGCFRVVMIEPMILAIKSTNDTSPRQQPATKDRRNDTTSPPSSTIAADGSQTGGVKESDSDAVRLVKKRVKEQKKAALHACLTCGVVYCWWCKRSSLRRQEKYRLQAV